MKHETVTCPACGRDVDVAAAAEKGREDETSPLTRPHCGAGFDRRGKLRREAAIGP
jgi:endogenous inhibitor of DNA gyrase (YacG/DUF329 family)